MNQKKNSNDELQQIEVNYSRSKDYTNLEEMFTHCKNHIVNLLYIHAYVYIGATNSPELRCQQHLEEKGMYKMKLLCKTQNKAQAKELEEALVNEFKDY